MQVLKHFHQGQMLQAVWYDNSEGGYTVGKSSVISIEIVMEPGQMAAVPWALVTFEDDRRPCKFNLALCNEVVL